MLQASRVNCQRCPLSCRRKSIVEGSGPLDSVLMIVDGVPGRDEDKAGLPQLGEGGRLLRATVNEACSRLGVDSKRVFYTYSARCKPYSREVTTDELEACLPWLVEELDTIQPFVVLALGALAQKQATEAIMQADTDPSDDGVTVLMSAYSPHYVLMNKSKLPLWAEQIEQAIRQAFNCGEKLSPSEGKSVEGWSFGSPDLTSPWLSADTEFDTLEEEYGSKPVGYSMSDGLVSDFRTDGLDSPWPHLFLHNIKADADHLGIDIHDLASWDDTMLQAYCTRKFTFVGLKKIGPLLTKLEWPCEIKDLLKEYTPSGAVFKSGVRKGLEKPGKWHAVPFSRANAVRPTECRSYAATDAVVTARIAQRLQPMLDEAGGWARRYYEEFEKPLIPVIMSMERAGVRIDPAALGDAAVVIAEARARTEQSLRVVFPLPINLASTQQMAPVLAQMGLIDGKRTKTGGIGCGVPNILGSFGVEKIEDIPEGEQGDIARALIEWRQMGKLKSTYVDKLLAVRDGDDRIHARLNQNTEVNRLSSSDPNLQNIPTRPKPGLSPALLNIAKSIRRAFIPRDGYVFVGGDFSQLQPRWWAHMTKDPVFVNAYVGQEKGDIYLPVAGELDITRDLAKPVVLGAMYGGENATLAKAAGVDPLKMGPFLERLHKSMPSLKAWPMEIRGQLANFGYVESAMGWRMFYPDYFSPVRAWSSKALREAANAPIIASEAGLVKAFMIAVYAMLREEYPLAKMVLVVHDELWIECPYGRQADEIKERLPIIAKEVGKRWTMIPIRFDTKIVGNWADGK